MSLPATHQPMWSGQWEDPGFRISILDEVVQDHEKGNQHLEYQGITRNHWKPSNARASCANSGCNIKFGLKDRKHHCRRCGDIFCDQCTKFERRLNNLAHPDPNGKLHKVCKSCFDRGPQTLGTISNLTEEFRHYKRRNQQTKSSLASYGYSFDLKKEGSRLCDGFKASLSSRLSGLLSALTTPDWKKAPLQVKEELARTCHLCKTEFGTLFKKRNHCTVCGLAICANSTCSSKDLIVYIPDELDKDKGDTKDQEPKLAVIKIVGSPGKEPDHCEYLRVCVNCQQLIQSEQVKEYQNSKLVDNVGPTWQKYMDVSLKLKKTQNKIEDHLPKYQLLIESMEIKSGAPRTNPNNRSNIQTLAKAVSDLSDHFTEYVLVLNTLKKFKPTTKYQEVILKNMIRANCDYYIENQYTFRELKRRLEDVTPLEILECIQAIVDKNAINSAYLSVKQLALETLMLCDKYELDNEIPQLIALTEEVILKELRCCIENAKENWEQHEQDLNEMLKTQLKGHRLIRLSKRQTAKDGSQHVRSHMLDRCDRILESVKVQIASKCSHRNFQSSKEELETLHMKLLELRVENADFSASFVTYDDMIVMTHQIT